MAQAVPRLEAKSTTNQSVRIAAVAWLLTAIYYFYQYALRSAPGVMMPELSSAFHISALGIASIAGVFYYGYSPFSLVAGAAMDRFGARRLLPGAAAAAGIGALLFATGNPYWRAQEDFFRAQVAYLVWSAQSTSPRKILLLQELPH